MLSLLVNPILSALNVGQALGGRALGIAVTGMLIVFSALVVISVFISVLPGVLQRVATWLPEQFEPPAPADPESSYPDEDAIVAALGFILHTEMQRGSE